MKYKIDVVRIRENSITLNGWAIGKSPDSKATFRVEDEKRQPVKFKHVNTRRDDVSQIYFKKVYDREFGFDIQFPYERGKDYYLLIRCEGRQAKIKYNEELIARRASVAHKRMEKLKDLMNMETVHVAMDFWKEHGLKALVVKSKHKLQGIDNDYDYSEWYELTKPTDEELAEQRKHLFDFEPMLSVVIPAYKTPERYLREMLDSIMEQTYTNWEICVADGSPRGEGLERVLKKYADRDRRVRYEILGSNRGISGNTNAALDMARGDFVILADHDDTLPPNAFYEVVKAINENPDCQVIYSDEDKLDMDGKALFDPHFKPDFNPDLLTSVNYICHLFVIRQDLLKQVGGFRQEFDGAQDYDFIFRCVEQAREVVHVPEILYHWRTHKSSTADNPASKMYAFEAGRRAIEGNLKRTGTPGTVEHTPDFGFYRVKYPVQGEPLVSVIIPNREEKETLQACVESIFEKTAYKNYEIIIVENNSSSEEIFRYYRKLSEDPRVHLIRWKKGFNYSAINNFGVRHAKGDYLLFLNNDVKVIDPDWMSEMLSVCQRKETGAVGVKLIYPDNTIQHAGCVVGMGGIAGNMFVNMPAERTGYLHKASLLQDMSCVTAACMMMKKEVFLEAGGFTEELAVAFNDVDLCLKVRSHGHLIVYDPYVKLYHYESKSRGTEDSEEKVRRFQTEIEYMRCHWLDILKKGDPYYNKNLSLTKWNYSLKPLPGMGKKKG